MLTLNKQSSRAVNTIDNIKAIIQDNKADIAFINELNYSTLDDIALINIQGYNIEFDPLYKKVGIARSVMYIKNNLAYKRMNKYENKFDSTKCIKVGLPKKNEICDIWNI